MLTRVVRFRKIVDYIAQIFMNHSHYLRPGHYVMANERFICKNDPQNINYVQSITYNQRLFGLLKYSEMNKSGYRNIFKKFLLPRNLTIKDNEESKEFCGTVFYLPAAKKGVKLFDFNNRTVLTVYKDIEIFTKQIENYHYFRDFFEIPIILSSNLEKQTITEELIEFKHKSKWTKSDDHNVTEKIFNTYADYFSHCIKEGDVNFTNYMKVIDSLKKDSIVSELAILLERGIPTEMLNGTMPCVKQHGDISPSNILLREGDSENIYFIDWEHSGDYVFFFDLFKRMDIEAVKYDNYHYLEKYKAGELDVYFEPIFEMFAMKYDKKHRIVYYYMYVAEYFFRRVLLSSSTRKESVKNRYKGVLTELLNEKQITVS